MSKIEYKKYVSQSTNVPSFFAPYMHAHASGDINQDGILDLVATFTDFGQPIKNQIKFIVSDGKGGFSDLTSQLIVGDIPSFYQVREVVSADFNGDSRPDFFFAAQGIDTPPNLVGEANGFLLSDANGRYRFTTLLQNDFSHSADTGDLNGDGAIDLVIGNFISAGTYRQSYVLINDGKGQFTQKPDFMPFAETQNTGPQIGSTEIADVNNDGKADLIFGDWGSGGTRIYLGNGTGNFANSTAIQVPTLKNNGKHANAADVKAFDADRDGDQDLVVSFIGAARDINDPNSYGDRAVQLLLNDGNGNFVDATAHRLPLSTNQKPQPISQWFVFLETLDFDRNGTLDIVGKNLNKGGNQADPDTPVLWLNIGRGYFHVFTEKTFQAALGSNGYPGPFEVVDADRDGGSDLLTFDYRTELLKQIEPLTRANGTQANDLILASLGNDTIDGSTGIDTLLLSAFRSELTIVKQGMGIIASGPDGSDSLINVERLDLRDGTLALDTAGNAGQVYRLYQAAFARAPDNAGLKHNLGLVDGGLTLAQMSSAFLASAEFQQKYGTNPTDAAYINALYRNVLGRDADPAGQEGWQARLNDGSWNRTTLLIGFSESPENVSKVGSTINDGIWLV